MGINKVQYGNTTLIDLTNDTVTADKLMQGYTAHDRSGAIITGTATGGGSVTQDQDGFIVLPPTGGGSSGNWSWMGKNPTKVKTLLNEKVYLKDTDYATWTPSSTTGTIVATQTLTNETIDVGLYDVIIVYRFHSHFEYGSGATAKGKMLEWAFGNANVFCGRPTNRSSYTSGVYASYSFVTQSGGTNAVYTDNNGLESFSNSASYGVYVGGGFNSSHSVSNNILTITPKTPAISARCIGSYFSETNASVVDQTASYYEQSAELWRVDKWTSPVGTQVKETLELL